MIQRYSGVLHKLADGLAPHKSEIGPATAAIRAELERLRADLAQARAERDAERTHRLSTSAILLNVLGPGQGDPDSTVKTADAVIMRLRAAEQECDALRAEQDGFAAGVASQFKALMDGGFMLDHDSGNWMPPSAIERERDALRAVVVAADAMRDAADLFDVDLEVACEKYDLARATLKEKP